MNIKKLSLLLSSALALGAISTVASDAIAEGTATASLTVSTEVIDNCTITTAAVAFGSYDPVAATDTEGAGSVTVLCTASLAATITLDQGLTPVGDVPAEPVRQMKDTAANVLGYFLYQADGIAVWGNTAPTGVVHAASALEETIAVNGKITAGQNVPAGAYGDTVTATVTF